MNFKKGSPESAGIPSGCLLHFLDRLQKKQVPMHSFLLMRHDTLIAEGYYAPYQKDTLHRMFSISKSFTSIAIGLLEAEGKLSLDVQPVHGLRAAFRSFRRKRHGKLLPHRHERKRLHAVLARPCEETERTLSRLERDDAGRRRSGRIQRGGFRSADRRLHLDARQLRVIRAGSVLCNDGNG